MYPPAENSQSPEFKKTNTGLMHDSKKGTQKMKSRCTNFMHHALLSGSVPISWRVTHALANGHDYSSKNASSQYMRAMLWAWNLFLRLYPCAMARSTIYPANKSTDVSWTEWAKTSHLPLVPLVEEIALL